MTERQTEIPGPDSANVVSGGLDTTFAQKRDDIRPQSILATLERLHGGNLLDNLQIELQSVVREVVAGRTGKPGKVVLEFAVSKDARLTGNEIVVTASLKSKMPDDPPESAVFYHDHDGGLHNEDPYQRKLFR